MGTSEQQSPERWSPGDLAECIHTSEWFAGGIVPTEQGPRHGEIRMVKAVSAARHPLTGRVYATLRFECYGDSAYNSIVFRKVTPRREIIERADERFCRDFGPGFSAAPGRQGNGT